LTSRKEDSLADSDQTPDTSVNPGQNRLKFFYGWWICIGGAFVMAMSSGINFHGFGNFIIPLSKEFGWSRTTVSAVFSLARLEAGFIGPVEGWAVDRLGPRKLMLVGIPVMGLGFILLSQVSGLVTFMLVYILGITLGNSLGMHVPASAAVANWFNRKRGLAFGIMWSGVGLGGLLVPALGWAIDVYGWRDASIYVGIFVIFVGVPVAALMRHKPEQYGFLPDGQIISQKISNGKLSENEDFEVDFTAREALQTSSFWFLSLSIMARSLVTGGVGLHLVPYFVGLGASPIEAAAYAGSVGVVSIPGRFGLSYLGDYFNRRYMMAISLLFMTLSIVLLATADSLSSSIPGLVAYSISQGGISVIPQSIIADYFGRKAFATISGFRSSIQMLGIIVGPVVSGLVYDRTGSYEWAFLGFAVASIVSMLLVLMALPPSPRHRDILETS
jgi:sugar phosphate permease|tara:strand:- start:319 stop:1650 length:1332 start_codon:yes stop_codon:yes gene_type:complete